MELGGKVREGREIIRYVLLLLSECYEIVVWIVIVTGEPSRKNPNNIQKHTVSRIYYFSGVCEKDMQEEVTQPAHIKKIKLN